MHGFVDLHNHQFAYLGFGGMAFHGRAFGDMAQALPWCDFDRSGRVPLPISIHGPGGMGDIVGNAMKAVYGSSIFGHKVGGYPQFDGWPHWDSVTHQSVYEDWLYRAVEGGLRLMVMLAVNSEFLCSMVNRALSCNDMEAADRQLAAATEMEASIDAKSGGPGQGWYRIVTTPGEARAVIAAGKLAVVLGIEVDYLFSARAGGSLSEDQLRQALDKYQELGVQHLFPIHFSNNAFGGTAFQNGLQFGNAPEHPLWNISPSPLNPLGTLNAYTVRTEDARASGYESRTGRRNVQGLTELGKTLIREMIARGMIIDIDHMSARSKADTLDICEAADYPVVSGHTGFVEISHGEKRHEGQLLPEEVERIRELGGMVAVIPHQGNLDEIDAWQGPGQPAIPHTCGNTANTVVQAYLYAVSKMQSGPVGFGTDLNGFAGLPGPRFGDEACPGGGSATGALVRYPFTAAATGEKMDRSVVGQKRFDVNFDGLAHVGMLPDLIADFEAMGLTATELGPLLNSAEGYVTLWEKAWRHSSGRLEPARENTYIGDFTGDGKDDILYYHRSRRTWYLGTWSGGALTWALVGDTSGFGQVGDGRPFWVGDFDGDGRSEVLFYFAGDGNWWLGRLSGGTLQWASISNTSGAHPGDPNFGQIVDGRPFWVGRFSRLDAAEVLSYFPGDDSWWLGSWDGSRGRLAWTSVGNTVGFGHAINDGRPFWVGDFDGDGRSEMLFHSPGDGNWWLGKHRNGQLQWMFVSNTRGVSRPTPPFPSACEGFASELRGLRGEIAGLQQELRFAAPSQKSAIRSQIRTLQGQAGHVSTSLNDCVARNSPSPQPPWPNYGQVWDGRPFWVADFSGDGRTDVLFYTPGDDNWWLGAYDGAEIRWSFAGNTAGFGHGINDGRPFWVGDFTGDGRTDMLFYYPGDDNWWLGAYDGGQLQWSFAGKTVGFGHGINDGRPFWVARFSRADRAQVLMYAPSDGNCWLGTRVTQRLQWTREATLNSAGALLPLPSAPPGFVPL